MKLWGKLAVAGASGALSVLAVFAAKKFVFDGHLFKDCRRCKNYTEDGAMLALQVHLSDDHHLRVDDAILEANKTQEHYKRRHRND